MSTSVVSSSAQTPQVKSWTPDCSIINSLAEKYSLHWQSNLMIAGGVVAVASAVAAFFLNMAAFGVAFVALAALLAYGAYCAYSSNNSRAALEQTVTELREQKQKLETDKNTLTATAAQLQRQFTEVQATNRHLNQTVSTLQTNTHNLELRRQELTHASSTIQADLNNLKHSHVSLQQRITQLQSAIPLLKGQITGFADQNVDIGKNLSVKDIETIGTDHHTKELGKKINGHDMTFNADVQELSEQIQRAKAVSAKLLSTYDDKRKEHLLQLQVLNTSHGNLEDLEKKLQAQTLTLTNIEQQITAKTDGLKNVNEKWAQAQISLENKTREITAETANLNQVLEDFKTADRALESAKSELLTCALKQEALKLLNEKLLKTQTSFEATKKSLNEEAKKLDRLKLDLTCTQAEVDVAKAELLAYQPKLEELKMLHGDLPSARTSFEETKKVTEAETTKLEQLKLEAYAAQSELTAAKNELATYAQKLVELNKLDEELSQVQSTLNDTRKASDDETLKLDELHTNTAAKQAELDAVLEKLRNGTDLLQKKNSNLELRQKEALQKAQKDLADANILIDQRKDELAGLEREIEAKKQMLPDPQLI